MAERHFLDYDGLEYLLGLLDKKYVGLPGPEGPKGDDGAPGRDANITEVTVTVDNEHSDSPTADAVLGGEPGAQTIQLNFHGLKGADGVDGESVTGPAGRDGAFASVTATADAQHLDEPTVDVELGGEPGAQTAAFAFHGLMGQQGAEGAPGSEGPAGKDGQTYYYAFEKDEKGDLYLVYDDELQTPPDIKLEDGCLMLTIGESQVNLGNVKGDPGADGEPGLAGHTPVVKSGTALTGTSEVTGTVDGAAAGDLYLNSDTGDIYAYADDAWHFLANIKGPQGPQGQPGQGSSITDEIKKEIALMAHPVGSYYWSEQKTDPATLFGGEWEPVENRFVYAAAQSGTAGQTGGASSISLTESNLPSHHHSIAHTHGMDHMHTVPSHYHSLNNHTHSISHTHPVPAHTHNMNHVHLFVKSVHANYDLGSHYDNSIPTNYRDNEPDVISTSNPRSPSATGTQTTSTGTNTTGTTTNSPSTTTSGTPSQTNTGSKEAVQTSYGTLTKTGDSSAANTGNTGSGSSINSMPPYVTAYCWKRTA